MRNLVLQYCNELATDVAQAKQLLLQSEFNRDGSDITYLVTDNQVCVCQNKQKSSKVLAEVPDIVSAEYLQLEHAICVATAAGEVLLINPDTAATSEGTYCDVGIECMSWSPTQEVVAFVTKTHNVVVMTCTYEVIGDEPLDAELTKEQEFMNVGWGKKETQFHGNAGKQAAKQPTAFQTPDNVQALPQQAHICWRGDGAYFAVSYVASHVGRTFKVYDCEGKLQYTAEKCNGLQPCLAWRPTGNWIAVPQQFADKSTVALFEKNGLRHREIVLPFQLLTEPIVQLHWSANSDILALLTATPNGQSIYLYTIGNYHWYLKQVLCYDNSDPLVVMQWDARYGAAHTLHLLLASGKQLSQRWHFAINSNEDSSVGVIDGKNLLLTDFKRAVVPPPMCEHTLQLDAYINAICWQGLVLYVYTSDRKLHMYNGDKRLETLAMQRVLQPDENLSQLHLANLTYHSMSRMLATHSVDGLTRLLLLDVQQTPYKVVNTQYIKGLVNVLCRDKHDKPLLYHVQSMTDGQIYKLSYMAIDSAKVECSMQLARAADHMACYAEGLVTLRQQQALHMNNKFVDEDVSSFQLTNNYLAYTKLNTLHFVSLLDQRLVETRNIERGAKLVTIVAQEARVIMQLPRGNLEAICPRVLALEQVIALLYAKNYQAAMQLLRKQRINLNIIFDHNVSFFHETIDALLAIRPIQWLCLFISELQNEDYTKSMYASYFQRSEQRQPANYAVQHKVKYVCELLCQAMERSAPQKYTLPIMTAYVKLGNVEQALLLVWQQKQKDALHSLATPESEQLLKYLLYLVDVNELYNVALGTYNFALVLYVAQKTQKDPKEYLPYLNELKALPRDYQKFKIDQQLKRYAQALSHLAAGGAAYYEEALAFIKRHKLYSSGLSCYKQQTAFLQQICVAYADQLRADARLDNASLMYERGGQLQQALLSAKHVLDWRRVLLLAQRAGEPLASVAMSMVTPLQQQGRHLEAYELVKLYGDSVEQRLEVLLQGQLFAQAIYEARMVQQQPDAELLDKLVSPALLAYADKLQTALHSDLQLFEEYKQRLLQLRQNQAQQAHLSDIYAPHNDIEEADLLSDTSSMHSSRYSNSSRGSSKSFHSSKNRRKHERKLLSLKPGNPFEDIALIDALHNHITKIAQQQQHVRDTCKALLELGGDEPDALAAALQRAYKLLLASVEQSLDDIWIPELVGSGQLQQLTGPNIDYQALQQQQRYALLAPLKRYKPLLNIIDWQHDILDGL